MVEIKLTKGMSTYVDSKDYQRLSKWKWYALWNGYNWYAVRNFRGATVYMHRVVMGPSGNECVDHINGDTLNNTRGNLRLASHTQNCWNRGRTAANTSGYKGVSWHKRTSTWRAFIRVGYRQIHLGNFFNKTLAAFAYDDAAIKYGKEFAGLNFS